MSAYDVIVLGVGGVGSAAAYHLARRGARVLGLDRFPPGHDQGSSHGQTRIIRKAYFEHPNYVPLLVRAYELWRELEQVSEQSLYFETGLVEVGPTNGVVVPGVLAAAQQHGLPIESIPVAEFGDRVPGFVLPPDAIAVFEREAGYLLVEDSIRAHCAAATALGAELRCDTTVVTWQADAHQVRVECETESFTAERLIITAGPWAGNFLAELGIPLRIRRKYLHWFATDDPLYSAANGGPAFFYELAQGCFYGFPKIDDRGVKIAEHTGGLVIRDPLRDTKSIEPADRRRVEQFRSHYLPGVSNRLTNHAVCYYTCSPDEHFLVDLHPEHAQVAFAAGLSGHGYKFASVLGEVLTDLTLQGHTDLPIDFLSCRRPGLLPA